MTGIDDLHEELNRTRQTIEVWVPWPEEVPWGARAMTIADPFGNHLRFSEPLDPADCDLPRW